MYLQKTMDLDIVDMGSISPYLIAARQSIRKEYNNNVIFKYSPNQKYIRVYVNEHGIDKFINDGYVKVRLINNSNLHMNTPPWPVEINDLFYSFYYSLGSAQKAIFILRKALIESFKHFGIQLFSDEFDCIYFVRIDNKNKIIAGIRHLSQSIVVQVFSQRPLNIMHDDIEAHILNACFENRFDEYPEHIKTASDLFTSMDELSKLYNVELTKDTFHVVFIQKLIDEILEYVNVNFKYRDITTDEQKELNGLFNHFSNLDWIDNGDNLYLQTSFNIKFNRPTHNRFTRIFINEYNIND